MMLFSALGIDVYERPWIHHLRSIFDIENCELKRLKFTYAFRMHEMREARNMHIKNNKLRPWLKVKVSGSGKNDSRKKVKGETWMSWSIQEVLGCFLRNFIKKGSMVWSDSEPMHNMWTGLRSRGTCYDWG